jgi:hypothetical protein
MLLSWMAHMIAQSRNFSGSALTRAGVQDLISVLALLLGHVDALDLEIVVLRNAEIPWHAFSAGCALARRLCCL